MTEAQCEQLSWYEKAMARSLLVWDNWIWGLWRETEDQRLFALRNEIQRLRRLLALDAQKETESEFRDPRTVWMQLDREMDVLHEQIHRMTGVVGQGTHAQMRVVEQALRDCRGAP